MKDQDTQLRFIQLRAQGQTFAHIAQELNVSRGTLVSWSRKFQFEIKNQRAIELEALQESVLASQQAHIASLAGELTRVRKELQTRDLAQVPTRQLYSLTDSLRRQIQREVGRIEFSSPVKDIPPDESCREVIDWQP